MPTIERAVLKGTIANTVQIRNILTAEITEVGSDTSELLWSTYVDALLADVRLVLHDSTHFYGYEVQQLNAGQWELIDDVSINITGAVGNEALMNAGAFVLIGKAPGIRHFGRKFFGALAETNVDSNILVISLATTAAACLLDYISPVNGLSGGRLMPGVVDSTGVFWGFVGGAVSSLLGTMRRRKPGNGM